MSRSAKEKDQNHIVLVEAYEGVIGFLSDELEDQKATRAIGLPVEEIAERLNCRISILSWNEWYRFESREVHVPTPVTQPVERLETNSLRVFESERIQVVPIPAVDPDYKLPFDERGLSPRSHGLINDSGFIFFASYCLNINLQELYQRDPFQVVILPMWNGIGYVAQMARATQVPGAVDIPFALVVTDSSTNQQKFNQEGVWTRHAVIRRQMEDVSLALADLPLVFGTRGKEIALAGRLPEANPPVLAPRFVEPALLDQIANIATQPINKNRPFKFFLYEPQQPASGVLTALDAVSLLSNQGIHLDPPVISAGPPMTFAPMKPRNFIEYWSSRGFVRELAHHSQWKWQREYPSSDQNFAIRLYPSSFEYLPNIWAELARGSLVLLSPAAAEGLAPGQILPQEILLEKEIYPENVAGSVKGFLGNDIHQLERLRQEVCTQVIAGHRGQERDRWLIETTAALNQLLISPPAPQNLSRVALLFLDRCTPLCRLAQQEPASLHLEPENFNLSPKSLSVVITCYEMGRLLKETVESVWASDYRPDEVLLINDGSTGEETLSIIKELEKQSVMQGLPLKVIHQHNAGLAVARNTGLRVATGEFISFVDGDDIVESEFYRTALQILIKHSHLGGVAAWAKIFGTGVPDGFWNAPQAELPFLMIENGVIVPCVTRTALLRQLGGYDTRQRYNYEDWELSIRILASGYPIITVPAHLMRYRIRGDSLYRSMTHVQNQVMRELMLETHQKIVSKFAVEIAMQLEEQWKQLAYSERSSSSQNYPTQQAISFCASAYTVIRRFLPSAQRFFSRF